MKRPARPSARKDQPRTERARLNAQAGKVTPEIAYEVYANLGDTRSAFRAHRVLEERGYKVSLETVKRWHKMQEWEAKVGYREKAGARALIQIAAAIPELPHITDLAQAVTAIEQVHVAVVALALKVQEATVDIELKTVDDLIKMAQALPMLLAATTRARTDLINILPAMAVPLGMGRTSAPDDGNGIDGEIIPPEAKPEPVPTSGLNASVIQFAKARQRIGTTGD